MKFPLVYLISLLLLSGCQGPQVEHYSQTLPALDLKQFLNGDLIAYGMLQDRSGKMSRRFTASLNGHWQGDTGTLTEHFIFSDGEEQDRIWTLQHTADGHYTGTAGDVIGTASGNTSGSVFNWQYQLDVPWQDGTIAVNLDDWLFLIDENHLINKTRLRKFGFTVGELTLVIEKVR